MLTLACCASASRGSWREAVPLAAGVECITCAMDLFDDIEEGDVESYGSSSDLPILVNAASALLMLGVSCLTSVRRPRLAIEAVRFLARAFVAAANGQHTDMMLSETRITVDQAVEIAAGKTASLTSAICEAAALVGGASPGLAAQYGEFGFHLGLVAQLADDLADFGEDLAAGKVSVPVAFFKGRLAGGAGTAATAAPDSNGGGLRRSAAQQYAWLLADIHRRRARRVLQAIERRRPALEYLEQFVAP